jgi:hypothetical protein
MARFRQVGTEASVVGLNRYLGDLQKIDQATMRIQKDVQKMAKASLKGQGEAAKVAGELAKKYEAVADRAKRISTVAASMGLMVKASGFANQARDAQRLAEQYRNIEREAKGVTTSQRDLAQVSKFVQENWAALTAAAGTLIGGLRGIQKAFEFGREGAEITQTAESFDFLMAKIGAVPGLLDQLRVAARGTVSDQELMSSTSTLLAGATDRVARQLANATPELLNIAKAAQKLNPALGDTTFFYESLARGIKRTSPLILDNLGVIVKVGEANKEWAAILGKTVDELTAEDKALALLNSVLKTGGTLIDQVGGNTESATDSFDRLNASLENIANTLKARLAPALASAAGAANILLTGGEQIEAALKEQDDRVSATAGSYEDYVTEMERAASVAGKTAITQEDLTKELMRLGTEADKLGDDYEGQAKKLALMTKATELQSNAYIILSDTQLEEHQRLLEVAEAGRQATEVAQAQTLAISQQTAETVTAAGWYDQYIDKVKESTEALKESEEPVNALATAYGKVNTNLSSFITSMRTNIAFIAGGGGELQEAANQVLEAWTDGTITKQAADQMLEDIGLAALALEEQIGAISLEDAQKEAVENYGIEWEDAEQAIEDARKKIEEIPKQIESSITIRLLIKKTTVDVPLEETEEEEEDFPPAQRGGRFLVRGRPGLDRNLVAIRASRGEVISVSSPGGAMSKVLDQSRSLSIGQVNVSDPLTASAFDRQMRNWLGD